MERKLLETQLRGFPRAEKHQVFRAPFPEHSSICRRMGWMWGAATSGEGKAKSTSAKTDPALKHLLVSFEFHQILQKQTGCKAQNTSEDVARDPWSTESHSCV